MTSNLGAAIPTGSAIGFGDDSGSFSQTTVERQIRAAFRPELLNRIDRFVIFRPFSRRVMRQILEQEVRKAFQRRGLSRIPSAVRLWAIVPSSQPSVAKPTCSMPILFTT